MAKRILIVVSAILVLGILLRGFLFRQMVSYETVGARVNYSVVNKDLSDFIESNLENQKSESIDEIIEISLEITTNKLRFTSDKNDVDPNKLVHSETAHCVGYAAFFATTCNYVLKKNSLNNIWVAVPQIGKLYFLGFNIHNWFDSSFLKDHDFVVIRNNQTGETKAVDPTLYDYFYIESVSTREQ